MLKPLLRSLSMGTCFAAGCCLAFGQTTQTSKGAQVKPSQSKVELAHWNKASEQLIGISQGEFAAMGFSKLTARQFGAFLAWAYARQQSAEEKGKQEARATLLTHSCGRGMEAEAAADKVNVFISAPEDSNSEIVSALRQKLRSIADVQIVYDKDHADLIFYTLSMESRLKGGSQIGYALTVSIVEPCKEWIGMSEGSNYYGQFIGHNYFTGANATTEVVEPAVANLDAKYIEEKRKSHAEWKRILLKSKE